MANQTEQLVVTLEARIRDFERNLAKASGTASKEFGAIERRAQQSARKMEGVFGNVGNAVKTSIGGLSGGFLAGGLAGLISEQTIRALGNVVKSVADMADEAHRVGLGVEDFQALTVAAHQAGVESDKVTDVFQKFNLELGEAASKGNDLSRILAANNVPLRDANGKLRDQKELFYQVVDLIKNAKTQQDAAVIAMAAFGRGAQDALPFLQQGSAAIQEGEQAARDTGAVISAELVDKAAVFDDAWTAAFDSWTARGKASVLEIMTEMQGLLAQADTFLSKSGLTSDALRGTGMIPGLNEKQLEELEWLFPNLKPTDASKATDLQAQLLDLTTKRAAIEKQIADAQAAGAAPVELQEYQDRLDIVLGQLDAAKGKLDAIKAAQGPAWERTGRGSPASAAGAPSTVIPKGTGTDDSGKSTAAAKAKTNALEAQRKALDNLFASQQRENASLGVEAESVGLSTYEIARRRKEIELLNAAHAAGVPITDQVKASIAGLASAYARGTVAVENAQRVQETATQSAEDLAQAQQRAAQQFEGTFGSAAKGFVSDLLRGVDAVTALQNGLSNLGDQLLNLALSQIFGGLGGTGSGGILGSLFGFAEGGIVNVRGYATGGHITGPGSGTSDSILARVSNGEFVVTAAATAKHRALLEAINSGKLPAFASGGHVGAPALTHAPGSAGAPVNVSTTINMNATGGDPKQNDDLAKKVAKECENSIRGLVVRELMAQRRPGGMLGG